MDNNDSKNDKRQTKYDLRRWDRRDHGGKGAGFIEEMKSFGRERAEHRLTNWLRETKACEALDLRGLYIDLEDTICCKV